MTATRVYMVDVLAAHAQPTDAVLAESVREYAPSERTLSVDDLGASRGDGVFETFGVVDGRVQARDAHLRRFVRSAEALGLPKPHIAQWRHAIQVAAAGSLPAGQSGVLKIVLTRGREGTPRATGWVTTARSSSSYPERRSGISVVTLDRGYASDTAARAPWLLIGAKTLSYASNMAALREAKARGASDAVYVSSDGFLLEGPTSSIVLRFGDRFVTTPASAGVLPGTTQADAFAALAALGYETAEELIPAEKITAADGVWLLSSVRLAVPVTAVDGVEIPVDTELSAALNEALLRR